MHGYIEDTKVAILGESSDKRQYLVQGPGRFQKRRWIDKEFIRTEDVGVCGMCNKVITSADSTVKGEEVPELGGRLGSLAHLKCVAEAHADRAEAYQQYQFETRGLANSPTFEEWLAEDDDPYEDERNDPAYLAYCEEMAAEYEERGDLAGSPREMACHPCHLAAGNKPDATEESVAKKKVVKLGPVAGADPTQTYVLECGHTAF